MEAGGVGVETWVGLCECERFLKAGVGIWSSEGVVLLGSGGIQEELGVGGSRRRSHRLSVHWPVLLTPGLHTRMYRTPGCPARVDCQGLPAQLKQTCSPMGVTLYPQQGTKHKGIKDQGRRGKTTMSGIKAHG